MLGFQHAASASARGIVLAIRAATGLILPASCLTCDSPVAAVGQLCAACFHATHFIVRPFCECCGAPFDSVDQGGAAGLCPACLDNRPIWHRARAAVRYDDQARRIVLPLKHADRLDIAPVLAGYMVRAGMDLLRDADVLVPVPLHRFRLYARRYNQAALLARTIARRTGLPVALDALQRHRRTTPLGGLGAQARATALHGAFRVRPSCIGAIAGKSVVLVDDVLTSGTTANECSGVLLAAGAAHVDVLVAARVPHPRLASPSGALSVAR